MNPTIVQDRKIWTIKVTSGPFAGDNATVHRDQVPEWIGSFMDLVFELVTVGKDASLVAINIRPRVRQQQQQNRREK